MDVLQQLIERVDTYVGNLIDVAEMSETDKKQLKMHLLAAQEILTRNGARELDEFIGGVTKAILSRF